ncbi:MAG: DUF4974 domain-containing protein [Thermoflavifilum sp.]|nr:DUF4974 domain-containing protein [Thermoflavifilum sp.]
MYHQESMDESIWELIVKMFSEGLTVEEQERLQRWYLENPEAWIKSGILQNARLKLISILSEQRKKAMIAEVKRRIMEQGAANMEKEAHSASLAQQNGEQDSLPNRPRRSLRGMWWGLAIMVVGVMGWWMHQVLFKNGQDSHSIVWKTISTAPGVKSMITLPDGSTIWLNAATELKYPDPFSDTLREVYLSGEAFFQIVHRPRQPFVIHTREMDVHDLGTEFNIRAYPDEDFIETTLISGSVAIKLNEPGKEGEQMIYLKPDQKLIFKKHLATPSSTGPAPIEPHARRSVQDEVKLEPLQPLSDHLIAEIAWKDNQLVFEDETFSSLAQRLARWYGIRFYIKNTQFSHQRFTGRADNVSLTQLLQILQKIKPFTYQITDTAVIIE